MNNKIALVMMLKNEEKYINVSIVSVLGIIDTFIIFDTGSTDNTIKIIKEFCKTHRITLHLKCGKFVDFSSSRNELLEFAEQQPDIDFLLLLDCNDQLRNGRKLKQFVCSKECKKETMGWLVVQQWFYGSTTTYKNVRFIRNYQKFRFKGVVHEYITKDEGIDQREDLPDDIVLYQDRTKDDDKTKHRFKRDLVLLGAEYDKDPTEPRTVFYYAQTYECLEDHVNAYELYDQRYKIYSGFWEERYESCYRMASISMNYLQYSNLRDAIKDDNPLGKRLKNIRWDEVLGNAMRALEFAMRAEPLILVARNYYYFKYYDLAYFYISKACTLEYPVYCGLFIDKKIYDYERWHMLGNVSKFVGKNEDGMIGATKAYAVYKNELDLENINYYKKKMTEM